MAWRLHITVIGSLFLWPLGAQVPDNLGIAATNIVIRHDRDDAAYLALGVRFPAVGKVGRGGDATLIASNWAITAAHVAHGMSRRMDPLVVTFEGRDYEVATVHMHPAWQPMGPHDIALLELAEHVDGIAPIALYEAHDELGQMAMLVGHGDTRTGEGGSWQVDGKRRGATNVVARADDAHLVFVFDEPPNATELEGTPGRGDSGGPAFLMIDDGEARLAGVSSGGTDGKYGPATYGARDFFGRVSTHLDWIRGVIVEK
jgi:hypothetical protein